MGAFHSVLLIAFEREKNANLKFAFQFAICKLNSPLFALLRMIFLSLRCFYPSFFNRKYAHLMCNIMSKLKEAVVNDLIFLSSSFFFILQENFIIFVSCFLFSICIHFCVFFLCFSFSEFNFQLRFF